MKGVNESVNLTKRDIYDDEKLNFVARKTKRCGELPVNNDDELKLL